MQRFSIHSISHFLLLTHIHFSFSQTFSPYPSPSFLLLFLLILPIFLPLFLSLFLLFPSLASRVFRQMILKDEPNSGDFAFFIDELGL